MGSSCKRPLSIYSSLMVILTVIGYFGVSDADVVLRETESENGLVLNKLQPSQQQQDHHPFRRFSINNDKSSTLPRNSKDAENESLTIDESMWDQIVIRALANPTEWVQLRQALDKVDADLRALTALENSKRNQSKSVPKWKFTYHRVMSPQINPNQTKRAASTSTGGVSGSSTGVLMKKTKAFAAVSLATLPQHQHQQQQQQQQQGSSQPSSSSSSNTIVKGNNLNSEDSLMAKGNPKLTAGKSFVLSPFHDYMSSNSNQNHLSHRGKEDEENFENEMGKSKKKWMTASTTTKNMSLGMTSGSSTSNAGTKNQSEKQSSISSFESSTLNIKENPSWSASGTTGTSRRGGNSWSRTQLEEEIAKMSSSSKTNDGSISTYSTSFHWRPWIQHRSYKNPKIQSTPVPVPLSLSHLSSTTVMPPFMESRQKSLDNSLVFNDHDHDHDYNQNSWRDEMEKYHARFHHHHVHHHGNHHHDTDAVKSTYSNPNVNSNSNPNLNQQSSLSENDNAISPLVTLDEDDSSSSSGSSSSSKEYSGHHSQRHHQRHNHPHLSSSSEAAPSSPPTPVVLPQSSFSENEGNSDGMDDQLFSPAHRISSLEYRI